MNIHGDPKFNCKYCEKRFSFESGLKRHYRCCVNCKNIRLATTTEKEPTTSTIIPKTFARTSANGNKSSIIPRIFKLKAEDAVEGAVNYGGAAVSAFLLFSHFAVFKCPVSLLQGNSIAPAVTKPKFEAALAQTSNKKAKPEQQQNTILFALEQENDEKFAEKRMLNEEEFHQKRMQNEEEFHRKRMQAENHRIEYYASKAKDLLDRSCEQSNDF